MIIGWFTVAWILWLVGFVVIEGIAIANSKPGDTLSEHIWRWFSIRDKQPGYRVRRALLSSLLAWLLLHFLSGGRFV